MAETTELETLELEDKTKTAGQGAGGPSAGEAADQFFRKGINKERKRREERFTTDLARYHVEPIKDARGRIDEAASLDALVKAGQPEAAAALEQRYAGRIAELSQENENLKQNLQKTRVTTAVREKLAMQHPANLEDATDLFLLRYNIKADEDSGDFIVCDKAGNPLHHKITANPLTIEDAVDQFFTDRPGLKDQKKGAGLEGLGSMKGSPGHTSGNDDLQAQYVEALASKNDALAAQIRREMQKRIRVASAE